jgi:hypothetical protein
MFGNHFYHKKIRKAVAAFGTMFNNVYVIRENSSGNAISQVKVPLSYAPKQKYLERIRGQSDLDNDTKVALKLPRMSFEIASFSYDQTRQLQKTNNFFQSGTNTTRNRFYSFVPYSINFQLNIYAKSQDDALQIVEQILPYFNPQYTLTMKPFSDFPDIKEDIPITAVGVNFSDDYEGPMEARRTIIYSIDFDMKINLYGPVTETGVITKAITNVYDIEGNQIQRITGVPDPDTITGDSDFGFNINIDNQIPYEPYVLGGYVTGGYVSDSAAPLILPYMADGYVDSNYVISYYN